MTNKILVLGRGYLGTEFERHGIETWGKDKFQIQFSDKAILGYQLEELKNYDVVVNCIGKSNTRWCEEDENFSEALFVNGYLPGIISDFCKENNIRFVQVSTGCLYDNVEEPNTESAFKGAHCNYTITKWIGELQCNKQDLIVRPRLYFSDVEDRNNLLCKLPKFNTYTGDKLDSFSCTSTIVGAVKALTTAEQSGIFNVAQIGSATIARIAHWCGLPIKGVHTANQLREKEDLYLVNNVMDVSKLLKFYQPTDIKTAVKLSYAELNS